MGCFPEILLNVSQRQILWSLCLVVFLAFTLRLPIQTSLSVAPKLQVCVRSGEKCENCRKTSTLHDEQLVAICRYNFVQIYHSSGEYSNTSFQNMDQEDENITDVLGTTDNDNFNENFNGMKIIQVIIASMGVITNIIVVIVFLNDRKLRRKIPNICIINQVCVFVNILVK